MIYDCCILFNEIDLLKIRMDLLDPFVDFFVIVELDKNFRGEKKQFFFEKESKNFSKYLDKIIYIKESDAPQWNGDGDWSIERFQRNCISKGLLKCKDEDIIMISDVDEIPDPKIITHMEDYTVSLRWNKKYPKNKRFFWTMMVKLSPKLLYKLWKEQLSVEKMLEISPILLKLKNHYYYMNCRSGDGFPGTVICKYKNLCFPQVIRDNRDMMPVIYDAGWHFSYLGGVKNIINKLKSIIDDRPEIIEKMKNFSSQEDYIYDCLENGTDIFGRNDEANTFIFLPKEELDFPNISNIVERYPKFFHFKL